jgi:hypothetical protein
MNSNDGSNLRAMDELKFRGGAQIGKIRTSWPFVTLTVRKDRLVLKAPLAGNYTFEPNDIVLIEPIPDLLTRGLRIRHRVEAYKENVEFLTFRDPRSIIEEIRKIGFPVDSSTATSGTRFRKDLI